MIDLTVDDKDKNSYIVDVVLNDNGTYTVKYASGREEVYPFSIHNINVELYRMEEQYKEYGKDYLDKIYPSRGFGSFLLGLMFTVDVMYFKYILDEGLNFVRGWLLCYSLYSFFIRAIPHIKQRKLFIEAKKKLDIIKLYMENKDCFKVDVVNPYNDKEEEWYLVNLANIDEFQNVDELNEYLISLDDEKKREEVKSLSYRFKSCISK